jgi:putative transposase
MGLRGREEKIDTNCYFITTTVVGHAKVFTNDLYCDILINNIKFYQNKYGFSIISYVIMPTHFHWIVSSDEHCRATISDIMRDIKKYSAWDLMKALEKDTLKKGLSKLFSKSSIGYETQERKFWMKRFHDEGILNRGMLATKMQYIHYNPVKAGMCNNPEDYKYSSARNYLFDDQSVLKVDTSFVSF